MAIIQQKVAARIACAFNDYDVQIAALAEQHQQRHSKTGGVMNEVRSLYLDINSISESISPAS